MKLKNIYYAGICFSIFTMSFINSNNQDKLLINSAATLISAEEFEENNLNSIENISEVEVNDIEIVEANIVYTEDLEIDKSIVLEVEMSNKEMLESEFHYVKDIPLPEKQQEFLYNECQKNDLDYILALSVIGTESDFNPNIEHLNNNGTIDYGLFQINSCNLKEFRKNLNISGSNTDPYNNIKMGVYELSRLNNMYSNLKGNETKYEEAVLSSYNKGVGGYRKNGKATKYLNRYNNKKEEILSIIDNANL